MERTAERPVFSFQLSQPRLKHFTESQRFPRFSKRFYPQVERFGPIVLNFCVTAIGKMVLRDRLARARLKPVAGTPDPPIMTAR